MPKGVQGFQKGNKCGSGRPSHTEEQKKMMRLTRTGFIQIIHRHMGKSQEQIDDLLLNDKTIPALDAIILKSLSIAISTGDERKLNYFVEQMFGKLTDKTSVEISGKSGSPIGINYSNLTTEQLKVLSEIAQNSEHSKSED